MNSIVAVPDHCLFIYSVRTIMGMYNFQCLKVTVHFQIRSYRIIFDVIKRVCKLFDDRMFNNLVISNLTSFSCIYLC